MKNILYKSFVVLAAGLMLGACDENAIEDHNEPVNGGAFIKFAHTAPEAPLVNFYLDNAKVSATAANSNGEEQGMGYSSNSVFPASYGYANVPAGSHTLQAIDTVRAGGSAEVITNASLNLNEGKHYTSFLIGETGAFETLVVEDNLPEGTYTQSFVRFVNVATNGPAAIDAEAVRTATSETPETRTAVGSDVAYKGNTAYVALESQGSYVIHLTYEGPEGEMVTLKSSSFSPVAGRVYTLFLRGDFADEAVSSVLIRDR